MKKNTDQNKPAADAQEGGSGVADLPTQGGLYEFDPATKSMRQVGGGAQADETGNHGATTGDEA